MKLVIILICLYDEEIKLICQPSYHAMSELTSMQAACWFGRFSHAILGGVSAHLYAEFENQSIDPQKLNIAIERLYKEHDILKLSINTNGIPFILPNSIHNKLEIEDFSKLDDNEIERCLLEKRQQWTHQQLDLAHGQTVKFSLSILKNNIFRLHIDTDMIAIDPSSFCRLMEDLALFYEAPNSTFSPPPDFFAWYDQIRTNTDLKKLQHRDRLWWKNRLPSIPPAPSLPFINGTKKTVKSDRLSTWLTPNERKSLQRLARKKCITLSSLVLGLFAYQLGNTTQDRTYRLNIPIFWREPILKEIQRSIGDFTNLSIMNVHMENATTLAMFCKKIADQLFDLLEHSHYSGVNIMRDLSRYHGNTQLAPVVFTAALDLEGENLFSERVHHAFGSMNWVISQGPQVALDAQIANLNGGILLNWDVRLDALPQEWVNTLFTSFTSLLKNIATHPEELDVPLNDWEQAIPSNAISESSLSTVLITENQTPSPKVSLENKAITQNKLFNIYLEALGQTPYKSTPDLISFTSLGLRPHHLKIITKRINEEYSLQLSPAQLVSCRNVVEVEKLLTQYI